MQTYIKGKTNLLDLYKELVQLYKFHTQDQKGKVDSIIREMDKMNEKIESVMGGELEGKNILEVGPGQKLPHLYYFARSNSYTGIDIDLPLQNLTVKALIKMSQTNGLFRAVKTLGRHILRIDSSYKKEMAERLGSKSPKAKLLQMDAGKMTFEDNSFDCIFSISVFEHLPEPGKIMQEIARVLKPGGVAYIVTHLYTSDTGIHDPKIYIERGEIPYWSHLQEDISHLVNANCYLNEVPLSEYEQLFNDIWPGSNFDYIQNDNDAKVALETYRAAGKLESYTDQELMTNVLVTIWKKP